MEMPSQGEVGQLAGGGAAAVELVAVKIKRRFYAFVFVLEFFIDSQPRRRNVSHATPNSKSKIEKVHSKATKRKRWRERGESVRGNSIVQVHVPQQLCQVATLGWPYAIPYLMRINSIPKT